jgi:hypothetical protein
MHRDALIGNRSTKPVGANMSALIDQTNLTFPKFEDNEAGITLKADGTFIIWSTFKDPSHPTEQQIKQMESLTAFAAALKLPQIMDVLVRVANDPVIFDTITDTGPKH